ncbi:MAG: FliM/FliN family flagellar motor switch protein [Planctomycetes bacterium]|nr:FliM/FliN family flagellar motor switch protein [Planctomycetota bacterium]
MTPAELVRLSPAPVVELDRDAHQPVDILVGGKPVARGEVVTIGDKYGVRVTSVQAAERARMTVSSRAAGCSNLETLRRPGHDALSVMQRFSRALLRSSAPAPPRRAPRAGLFAASARARPNSPTSC